MLKFKNIRIENFLSIEDQLFYYAESGLTLVLGENKDNSESNSNFSGKTNIMTEALSWVLFGKGTKEIKPDGKKIESYTSDSVIRSGGGSCRVSLVFSIEDKKYYLERRRENGDPKLELWHVTLENIDLSKPTTPETQKLIEKLIGFTHATFTQTFFFGKGSARFSLATDSERKNTLEQVLQMGAISEALKKAKGKLEVLDKEWVTHEKELIEINTKMARAEGMVSASEISLKSWKEGSSNDIAARHKEHEETLVEHALECVECERIEVELHENQKEFKALNLGGIEFDIGEIEISIQSGRAEKIVIEKSIERLTLNYKRILQLKGNNCPVCSSKVSAEDSVHVCKKIALEMVQLNLDKDAIGDSLTKVDIPRLEKLTEEKKKAQLLQDMIVEKQTVVVGLNSSIERKKNKTDRLHKEVQAIRDSEKKFREVLTEDLDNLSDIRLVAHDKEEQISKLEEEIASLEFWVKGFGTKGIKSMMICEVLPLLTQKTNEYLAVLAGPDYRVDFEPESYTAKGEVRSKFDVKITMGNTTGYHAASGGERQRIDFCIALAIQSLQAICSGGFCNIFILDEPFESVDETGVEGLIAVLKTFSKEHDVAIYVVTHLDSLQAHFDEVITVVKENGVSRIE